MAQGRMLLKSISGSRKLAKLKCDGARLLFTWLLSHLNKYGCFHADPTMVNALVFTRLGKSHTDIEDYLDDLENVGLIKRYKENGDEYLYVPDFIDKQPSNFRPEREADDQIPHPDKPSRKVERALEKAGIDPARADASQRGRDATKDLIENLRKGLEDKGKHKIRDGKISTVGNTLGIKK